MHVSIINSKQLSRIWYVCAWSSEGEQRLAGCMLSYSVKVLRTLRLKNRTIVNVLVRCELYVYMCTKVHISQLYRTGMRQEKEISYNNGSNPASMFHHGVSATEPLIPNFSLSCG